MTRSIKIIMAATSATLVVASASLWYVLASNRDQSGSGNTGNSDCSGPGDSCSIGYTCIQKCGPPVSREDDSEPGYYCELNEVASQPQNCPICLAANTMIDTPSGPIDVSEIKVGTLVWSLNEDAERIAVKVKDTSSTITPANHQVIVIRLADDRVVGASPNHLLADGRLVGALKVGDVYDGATVLQADSVPYWDDRTYDLLPASATGSYWAGGILMNSTLMAPK